MSKDKKNPEFSSSSLNQMFNVVKLKAEKILQDSSSMSSLIQKAMVKIARSSESIGVVKQDLSDLIDLLKSYVNGSYREIPWKSIVAITAGILYFVNPFDALPDFLAGIGFLDDIKILELVLRQVHDDLNAFRKTRKT